VTDPEFPERDVVLFLHDQVLREYGGIHGVKDQVLLDNRQRLATPDTVEQLIVLVKLRVDEAAFADWLRAAAL
jgi:prophage maintenance system killer protein